MSLTNAAAWNISIHSPRMLISIGMGVEFGSALVPDVACCSIASTNDVGSAPIVIGIFIGSCARMNDPAASRNTPIQHLYTNLSGLETQSAPQTHVCGGVEAKRETQILRLNAGGEAVRTCIGSSGWAMQANKGNSKAPAATGAKAGDVAGKVAMVRPGCGQPGSRAMLAFEPSACAAQQLCVPCGSRQLVSHSAVDQDAASSSAASINANVDRPLTHPS